MEVKGWNGDGDGEWGSKGGRGKGQMDGAGECESRFSV